MKVDKVADQSESRDGERYFPRVLIRTVGGKDAWGSTEAYVCTECGWFEEYVADVKKIPWDKTPAKPHTPTSPPYR